MKKVFAIIAILVVLVGAVFADAPSTGTANLKVVTLIQVIEPIFKLTTAASDSGVLVGTPATVATMETPTTTDGAANDAYHVIAANTLSSTKGTTEVEFYVVQTNDCKTYKTYTFTASAEDLVMVKAYDHSGSLVAYGGTPTTDNHRVFAVDHTTVETFDDADTQFSALKDDSSSSAYRITYTGDEVASGTVASFTCTWTNDVDAVPGQYEANIRLTVTSN
ncbi:MAG: hypothetical protein IJ663_05650 [Spirochaetales bacterium]|nr:hypothetical protein [Spirochaetales bacterium]